MAKDNTPEDKDLSPEEREKLDRFKQRVETERKITMRMGLIRHKILVASGKGGVGKTTAAVNLSLALTDAGDKVGLLDADIHGPGVPLMLGMADVKPTGDESGIYPEAYSDKLVVMSMAFLLAGESDAVIWRGPLKMAMIDNFLADINWGELDWLVADTPPGTGDEILSLTQRIKDVDGLIMVTTPQAAAVASARKSLTFAAKVGIPILGVVENMGPLSCPKCGEEIRLFGGGGGERVAAEFGVPFLGSVPFDPDVVSSADEGKPVLVGQPRSAAAEAWRGIAAKLRETVTRKPADQS
ncbi:MAG: Mrp/NBP35 family ATP-binding protein [Candidatus Zixiibacteriota bacterium]|jgi:Mrp family chromosome partitioning ATPase